MPNNVVLITFAVVAAAILAYVWLAPKQSTYTQQRGGLATDQLMPSLAKHRAFVKKVGAGAGTFPSLTTEYPALMTRFASSAPGREGRSDNPALGKRLGAWHDPREDDSVRYVRGPQIREAMRTKRFAPEMLFNIGEDFYDQMK
jgi:hypothetical protein